MPPREDNAVGLWAEMRRLTIVLLSAISPTRSLTAVLGMAGPVCCGRDGNTQRIPAVPYQTDHSECRSRGAGGPSPPTRIPASAIAGATCLPISLSCWGDTVEVGRYSARL